MNNMTEEAQKTEEKENLQQTPISKLVASCAENSLPEISVLCLDTPSKEEFGPAPSFTPSFAEMKKPNPYI